MPTRREPRQPETLSYLFRTGAYAAKVTIETDSKHEVAITYYRHRPDIEQPKIWRPNETNADEVVLVEGTRAPDVVEGQAMAKSTLSRLAEGELTGETRPIEIPIRPQNLGYIAHPAKMLKAVVLRWPDVYEVRLIGYVKDGYARPVQTPSISRDADYGWARLDTEERLLADTEQEALSAAKEELARLAEMDLPLKEPDRPDWLEWYV